MMPRSLLLLQTTTHLFSSECGIDGGESGEYFILNLGGKSAQVFFCFGHHVDLHYMNICTSESGWILVISDLHVQGSSEPIVYR